MPRNVTQKRERSAAWGWFLRSRESITKKPLGVVWVVDAFIPTLRRQREMDLCKFQASLVDIISSGLAIATQQDSKKERDRH